MEKLSCITADVVISTNLSYKKHIIQNYCINKDKVFVVRNDPKKSEILKESNHRLISKKHKAEILYVGSINKQDNVILIVYVINILVKKFEYTSFNCTVLGEGEELSSIKTLISELELDLYFKFTGWIYNRNLVRKYIQEADICIETASKNTANTKSTFIKIMEYMSAGKPIVAFDLEETRFSAQNSAVYVKPDDLEGFAIAIKMLLENNRMREEMGKIGISRIKKELNWENSAKQLIAAYKNLF
jgi:glycosyltransferase involved in cell wall biosynthesis